MTSRLAPALAAGLSLYAGSLSCSAPALAETITLAPVSVTEWKAVHGSVETRDVAPARARIGGVVVELTITEGDEVEEGQAIGLVRDDKISFQIEALDGQLAAFESQLKTADTELDRAQKLIAQGVVTRQRLDQLSTQSDVLRNQIASTRANRAVLEQQQSEGEILAPVSGKVLSVPVTPGAVIMPGEAVATIGGGGFFLRLALPERLAPMLAEGAEIRISTDTGEKSGTLARIYPQIEGGRVTADVEVEALSTRFVDARVLVDVPVGDRQALTVPQSAIASRNGLDFVTVDTGAGTAERVVVTGGAVETTDAGQGGLVEILSGLSAGDRVIVP
ncbi:efflux RND transporter periplasmic adaptor subunit [Pseudohoeflea suaedae]|uniref:Efflux RND transporter periplasmic adaptor subunit n=1 Tax=Pseudohoeflea suaedae TaxID=877384 RepID=A0A4R5PPB4_9HYPH|nr:efflux RND transporter periplasmic adaptor subunit [Pseudohoeflea suaedae]TDH38768.1 efflux RND transporter periplasmic adaptor subunit [Pseudohoeflea suaedae]